jgi:hypothetical protein
MGLEVERGKARSNQSGQLDAFIATCRSALHMVAGFEFPIMSILTAMASAPLGEMVWTSQGAGLVTGTAPSTALRQIALAESAGLLRTRQFGDRAIVVTLSEEGWAVVRQLEAALR